MGYLYQYGDGVQKDLKRGRQWYEKGAVAVLRASPAGKLLFCPVTQLDISASRIRGLLAEGRSPRYLLPGAVLEYIQVAGLYQQ